MPKERKEPVKSPKKTPVKKVESEEKKRQKKIYQQYIKSKEFQKVREAVLERDGYRCRFCGMTQEECADAGLFLSVHHSDYRFCGCADQREIDDCITICNADHFRLHQVMRHLKHFGDKSKIEENINNRNKDKDKE